MLESIIYSIVNVLTSHVRKVTKNSLSQLRQGFILDVPVSHDQIFSPQTTGIVKSVAKHVGDARRNAYEQRWTPSHPGTQSRHRE